MNIPLLIVLKDFILFCEEHEITEPTKKDIQDYVTSNHFNFLNESEYNFDIVSFENELEKLLVNIFKNKIGIASVNTQEQPKKKHKYYELITLFKPESSKNALEQVEKVLKIEGVNVANMQEWGIKNLAYPCRGYEQGFYLYFELYIDTENEKEIAEEIEKELKENENIIKILIVATKSGIQ